MEETVVLFSGTGIGHLAPMVELAKLFLRHGFTVTIAIIDPSISLHDPTLVPSNPSISFHVLPSISIPSSISPNPVDIMLNYPRLHIQNLHKYLSSLASVRAVILDFFCTDMLDVARELQIPAYLSFSSAAGFAVALNLPFYHSTNNTDFKDMGNTPIHFPGAPPIPASHMAGPLQDRKSYLYESMIYHLKRLPEADGILLNSIEWLENNAVKAIKDDLCLPGRSAPPVYCIGPLVAGGEEDKVGGERHECLTWLDSQPKQSVVFLCFGSLGSLSMEQLKEIAVGLEKSGQRFLLVVPRPPNNDQSKDFDLDMLLPEGFIQRTKDRGMIVKLWAPQAEVLRHESIGGFVTHCGWNSTLEAITAGVPMICWPMYAEQWMNKVFIVEEMRLGVGIKGYDEGLVRAEELEAKIRWLMESEGGNELRDRTALGRVKALEAVTDGGSSFIAFMEFLKDVKLGRGVEGH